MKKFISLFLLTASTAAYGSCSIDDIRDRRDQYLVQNAHELVDIFFEKEFPKGTSTSLLISAVDDLVNLTILKESTSTPSTGQKEKENRPTSVPIGDESFTKAIFRVAGFLFSFREDDDRDEVATQFKKAIRAQIENQDNKPRERRFRSITPFQ